MTVSQVCEAAKNFAAGCDKLGLIPTIRAEGRDYRFMGIFSKNRKEWNIAHIANMHVQATTVGFFDTLGEDGLRFIINQTEMTTVCVTNETIRKVVEWKKQDNYKAEGDRYLHRLTHLISFDNELTHETAQKGDEVGLKILTFEEVIKQGKQHKDFKVIEPVEDDCVLFSYTSGTTGEPKGVKVTHKMMISTAEAVQLRMGASRLGETDTYISYLPAPHSFEATLGACSIIYGMRCGFYSGDVLKLVSDDVPALQPTFFPVVPRLLNKIYAKITDGVSKATGCKGWLVNKAINTKLGNLQSTGSNAHGCYDKLVFKKMKATLGGNVRVMLTGSAPVSKEVLNYLKICFCCTLVEGYGMTETCAGSCV